MTKASVKTLLGLESDAELARFFNVSRGAVFHWPEEQPIPDSRQWELKARRPDLFAPATKSSRRRKPTPTVAAEA
ncbi:hypothetical protein [Stenotrophomonas maltophilia]